MCGTVVSVKKVPVCSIGVLRFEMLPMCIIVGLRLEMLFGRLAVNVMLV
jgi:hypothetical protein